MPKGRKKAGKKRVLKATKEKKKKRAKKCAESVGHASSAPDVGQGGAGDKMTAQANDQLAPGVRQRVVLAPARWIAAAAATAPIASGHRMGPSLAPLDAKASGRPPVDRGSAGANAGLPSAVASSRASGPPPDQRRERGALLPVALKTIASSADSPLGASAVQDRRGSAAQAAVVTAHAPVQAAACRPGSGRSLVSSAARGSPLPVSRPASGASTLPLSRPSSGAPTRGMDTVEHDLVRAAELLMNADYVLIAAGAGFSADSGLPVYKDIANVDAYKRLGLTYADLCTPDWLQRDPDLFFGFWGSCFNDYMDTSPHRGYYICKAWADTNFHASTSESARQEAIQERRHDKSAAGHISGAGHVSANSLTPALERLALTQSHSLNKSHSLTQLHAPRPPLRPLSAPRGARAAGGGYVAPEKESEVFVYTSNVDTAFERVGFAPEAILEIHGNVCDWQCAKPGRCRRNVWRLPSTHRFAVDKKLMRAPRWTLEPLPGSEGRDQGQSVNVASASGQGALGSSLPPKATALNNLNKVSDKVSVVLEADADQAASACTTHRAQAPATSASPAWPVSGGGMQAVRALALASAAAAAAAEHALAHSNQPDTRSCCSSSSSSSSSSCPSSPPAAEAVSSGTGGGFSLSAYGRGGGMRPPPPVACHDTLVTLQKRGAASREVQRAKVGEVEAEGGGCDAHAQALAQREKVLNHIRCAGCGRAARPNVLMFDDDDWVDVESKEYKRYAKNALAAVKEQGARLVIIEGGCGKRVPTVRQNSDKLVKLGAQLIRINLDYPGSKNASRTVSLEMRVLEALEGIDMAIRRLRRLE